MLERFWLVLAGFTGGVECVALLSRLQALREAPIESIVGLAICLLVFVGNARIEQRRRRALANDGDGT